MRRRTPRPLTHDERIAAEAAFQRLPFNPKWSKSARAIYDGLVYALDRLDSDRQALFLTELRPEDQAEEVMLTP